MYLYKYIYIGGLMEYISKKVAAYGQFVLVLLWFKVNLDPKNSQGAPF